MISPREVLDISVLIPALNEEENITQLIPRVKKVVEKITPKFEVVVIDGGSIDRTKEVAIQSGARVILQSKPGYGVALKQGFESSSGKYIVTMDADLSHEPEFISRMWEERDKSEVVIASRYIRGSSAQMSPFRRILSIILNKFFSTFLSVPIKDLSSGFRMYKRDVIESIKINSSNFEVLEEIILKACSRGWRIAEIPFNYRTRRTGKSHVKLLKFGIAYLQTFYRMWQLRNSIDFADYDERAFYSRIPFQRYWQKRRHHIILDWVENRMPTLDIGCGSSKIIIDLPEAVALDVNFDKLLYLRKTNRKLVNADGLKLPFKDGSFFCVICSQVIEHLPSMGKTIFKEINRVLRKEGILIIGTPDYGTIYWPIIEKFYSLFHRGGYADEHITHYTYKSLKNILERYGFKLSDHRYILKSELIIKAKKT